MVVLGQWPYQHAITLDQLKRQTGAAAYYLVDLDKIVSHARALDMQGKGYILDDTFLTVMSEDLHQYISSFKEQSFSPEPHSSVQEALQNNKNELYTELIDGVKASAASLVINDQSSDIMQDIGAQWNDYLGIWTIDAIALRMLREKRRSKTDGRIQMRQDKGGLLVEIWGDVTPHISLLKDIGGKYDEDKDIWYIPMSAVHKVLHIVSV